MAVMRLILKPLMIVIVYPCGVEKEARRLNYFECHCRFNSTSYHPSQSIRHGLQLVNAHWRNKPNVLYDTLS